MSEPYIFMQYNDPKHSARSVKTELSSENITVLDWPAQSPDLNPIENLWGDVKRGLGKKSSKNADELFQKVKEIWLSISIERCQRLVGSLPRRWKAVLESKVYPTKY
uniref:Transposable element Tc1 transposase n=1 Tax=Bactrocera latifrons TaxID=174628 RepID=A0A0K8VLY9_BACLA